MEDAGRVAVGPGPPGQRLQQARARLEGRARRGQEQQGGDDLEGRIEAVGDALPGDFGDLRLIVLGDPDVQVHRQRGQTERQRADDHEGQPDRHPAEEVGRSEAYRRSGDLVGATPV
jgi:hypothetical protein